MSLHPEWKTPIPQEVSGNQPQATFIADIEEWFTYHAPNEDQQKRYVEIRAAAKNMAYAIMANSQPSADRTAALRKLREVVWTVNASIALEK